jgi:hypothetical protein
MTKVTFSKSCVDIAYELRQKMISRLGVIWPHSNVFVTLDSKNNLVTAFNSNVIGDGKHILYWNFDICEWMKYS